MALRFVDSFDDRNTAYFGYKYNAGSGNIVAGGRNGTQGWNVNGLPVTKSFDAQGTWIIGIAGYFPGFLAGGFTIAKVRNGGIVRVALTYDVAGFLTASIYLGATYSASIAMSVNTWHYIEFKVVVSVAAGEIEVRLDEVLVINEAGLNTNLGGGLPVADNILFAESLPNNIVFDDLYICDGSGGIHDDFLGDNRVECILPNGAGAPATAEWVSSGGGAAIVGNVDENPPNGDTDYNLRDGIGLPLKDVWAFPSIASPTGIINGVQVNTLAKKDDAGAATMEHVVRSGGADYNSASFNLPTGNYIYQSIVWDQDPDGPAAWDIASVNAAEFGYRRST